MSKERNSVAHTVGRIVHLSGPPVNGVGESAMSHAVHQALTGKTEAEMALDLTKKQNRINELEELLKTSQKENEQLKKAVPSPAANAVAQALREENQHQQELIETLNQSVARLTEERNDAFEKLELLRKGSNEQEVAVPQTTTAKAFHQALEERAQRAESELASLRERFPHLEDNESKLALYLGNEIALISYANAHGLEGNTVKSIIEKAISRIEAMGLQILTTPSDILELMRDNARLRNATTHSDGEVNSLKSRIDELEMLHKSGIRELYRLLDIADDGEYRWKWALLGVSTLVRDREKLLSDIAAFNNRNSVENNDVPFPVVGIAKIVGAAIMRAYCPMFGFNGGVGLEAANQMLVDAVVGLTGVQPVVGHRYTMEEIEQIISPELERLKTYEDGLKDKAQLYSFLRGGDANWGDDFQLHSGGDWDKLAELTGDDFDEFVREKLRRLNAPCDDA